MGTRHLQGVQDMYKTPTRVKGGYKIPTKGMRWVQNPFKGYKVGARHLQWIQSTYEIPTRGMRWVQDTYKGYETWKVGM